MEVRIRKAPDSYQLSYYPLSPGRKEPKGRHACFKQCQLLCDSSRLRNVWGEWSPCFGFSVLLVALWQIAMRREGESPSMLCEYGKYTRLHLKLCSSTILPGSCCDCPIWAAYLRWMFKKSLQCERFLKVEMTFLLSLQCSVFPKHINIEFSFSKVEKYKMWVMCVSSPPVIWYITGKKLDVSITHCFGTALYIGRVFWC